MELSVGPSVRQPQHWGLWAPVREPPRSVLVVLVLQQVGRHLLQVQGSVQRMHSVRRIPGCQRTQQTLRYPLSVEHALVLQVQDWPLVH